MENNRFINVFRRTEIKYEISEETYPLFLEAMESIISPDAYGLTTICNIYYDTENRDLISRSLEKPDYKEKLRLRSYGTPGKDSTVFLEIKKKYDGVVYKRRADMSLREAERFLNHGIRPRQDSQILRELSYFCSFYHPQPALFLAYDRQAYVGKQDENLRMTIDRNIRYREDDLYLEHGDAGELLNPEGGYLLEVKANGALPLEIIHIFEKLKITPKSFSKYGAIYTKLHHHEAVTKNASTERAWAPKVRIA